MASCRCSTFAFVVSAALVGAAGCSGADAEDPAKWPYYLIATTHFDIDENSAHEDFGYQDKARSLLVDKMVGAHKWRVVGSVDVRNACHTRLDPKHLCEHDGKAMVVSIDG